MGNAIQRLLPRHYGLLRLCLAGTYSNSQMASMLGYTPEGLRNVTDSPLFQDELARRRKDLERTEAVAVRDGLTHARDLLNQTSVAAVEKMEEIMATAGDQKIQLDAADKILKYAIGKGDQKQEVQRQIVVLSEDKLIALRAVMEECGFTSTDNGPTVKVESKVVEQPHVFNVISN
jgi:hypothetical protein